MRLAVIAVALLAACNLYTEPSDPPSQPPSYTDASVPSPDAELPTPSPDASPPLAACTPADAAPSCEGCTPYETLRQGMVGRWQGQVNVPPNWQDPGDALVEIQFRADDSYSVACDTGCTVLYWGNNAASPQKRWSLVDIWANGAGVGHIWLTFTTGDARRDLEAIRLSEDSLDLGFELWSEDHGPVTFSLSRCAD